MFTSNDPNANANGNENENADTNADTDATGNANANAAADTVDEKLADANERKQVNGRVPAWLKEVVKNRDDVTLQQAVEDGLRVHAGDGDVYQTQIQVRQQQIRENQTGITEIDAEIQKLQLEKERLEEDTERLRTEMSLIEQRADNNQEAYETKLEELEERLLDGLRVFEGISKVKEAAELAGIEPADVIKELQERNPRVPDHAFMSGLKTTKEWDGLSENKYG